MAKKILLVDDDPYIVKTLQTRLAGEGYEVESAADGIEAVDQFMRSFGTAPYDLVILDIMMPRMDGEKALTQIREAEEKQGILLGNGTPVLMLTAKKKAFMESFRNGCDDFILKPYDSRQFLEKVRMMTGGAETR